MTETESETLTRLKQEIEAERKIIATLPNLHELEWLDHREYFLHLNRLDQKLDEYELLREAQRVVDIIRKNKELYPRPTEDCAICFETFTSTDDCNFCLRSCCGNIVCVACMNTLGKENLCPFCRSDFECSMSMESEEKYPQFIELIRNQAERGLAMQQAYLALCLEKGWYGLDKDLDEARRWFEMAVAQDNASAMCNYAKFLCREMRGEEGPLHFDKKAGTKAMVLMERAAELGNGAALITLGNMHWLERDIKDPSDDDAKALYYFTLAWHLNRYPLAARMLGSIFCEGQGCEKSMRLAKHYYEEAALKGDALSCANLAVTLEKLEKEKHGGADCIVTGHSNLPKRLYWARRAIELADDEDASWRGWANQIVMEMMNSWQFLSCGNNRCRLMTLDKNANHENVNGHKIDCFNNDPRQHGSLTDQVHRLLGPSYPRYERVAPSGYDGPPGHQGNTRKQSVNSRKSHSSGKLGGSVKRGKKSSSCDGPYKGSKGNCKDGKGGGGTEKPAITLERTAEVCG
eukprot:scaffold2482_cov50-Cyclotella_meneghiniana.AAC.1